MARSSKHDAQGPPQQHSAQNRRGDFAEAILLTTPTPELFLDFAQFVAALLRPVLRRVSTGEEKKAEEASGDIYKIEKPSAHRRRGLSGKTEKCSNP